MRCEYERFAQSDLGKCIKGFYFKSKWYSLKWIDGAPYKQRVETLIFNHDMTKLYMSLEENEEGITNYRIPGGHVEQTTSKLQQAHNECKEEAKIVVRNMKYVGSFIEYYNVEHSNVQFPIDCRGQIVELYIGRYESHYNKPVLSSLNDNRISDNGKFYDLEEIYHLLKPGHKLIVDTMLVDNN
jgi:8-oxo-dGTP pyrophosphatase MutT (NUDIX family)